MDSEVKSRVVKQTLEMQRSLLINQEKWNQHSDSSHTHTFVYHDLYKMNVTSEVSCSLWPRTVPQPVFSYPNQTTPVLGRTKGSSTSCCLISASSMKRMKTKDLWTQPQDKEIQVILNNNLVVCRCFLYMWTRSDVLFYFLPDNTLLQSDILNL